MKPIDLMLFAVALLHLFLLPSLGFTKGIMKEEITVIRAGNPYYNRRYVDNCVAYVRWLTGGRLPIGLHTVANKKKLITSPEPGKGRVAVMAVSGDEGHLAYVLDVHISNTQVRLTLLESNSPYGVIRKRTITAIGMHLREVILLPVSSATGNDKKHRGPCPPFCTRPTDDRQGTSCRPINIRNRQFTEAKS